MGAKAVTKATAMATELTMKVNKNDIPKTESKAKELPALLAVLGNKIPANLPDMPDFLIIVAGTAAKM
jgi:hypothetical protein